MTEKKCKGWLIGMLMAALILPVHTLPVSAYTKEAEQETGDGAKNGEAEDNAVIREEKPADTEKTPFSISGNGQLVDDVTDDSSKQFFTIQTENGSPFFIVVDRSREQENVYMLSPVDEHDLAEFLDEKDAEPEMPVIPDTEPDEGADADAGTDTDAEPEDPDQKTGTESGGIGAGALFTLVLLAAGGAGAYCYIKMVKRKREDEDAENENLEFSDHAAFEKDGQDDEEYDAESGADGEED